MRGLLLNGLFSQACQFDVIACRAIVLRNPQPIRNRIKTTGKIQCRKYFSASQVSPLLQVALPLAPRAIRRPCPRMLSAPLAVLSPAPSSPRPWTKTSRPARRLVQLPARSATTLGSANSATDPVGVRQPQWRRAIGAHARSATGNQTCPGFSLSRPLSAQLRWRAAPRISARPTLIAPSSAALRDTRCKPFAARAAVTVCAALPSARPQARFATTFTCANDALSISRLLPARPHIIAARGLAPSGGFFMSFGQG